MAKTLGDRKTLETAKMKARYDDKLASNEANTQTLIHKGEQANKIQVKLMREITKSWKRLEKTRRVKQDKTQEKTFNINQEISQPNQKP